MRISPRSATPHRDGGRSSGLVWPASILGVAFAMVSASTAIADDWPQWRGPDRDGVWHETGLIEQFESGQLPILWRAEIASGYSGPTVADGRVYVTDRVTKPEPIERVHAFDAGTGEVVWSYSYPCTYEISYEAGPRASVLIDEGRAYSLGTMGHLHCFDAGNGEIVWKRDLNIEYEIQMPIWGISASPVIEGDLLISQIGGSDGACIVALDKKTGHERWRALDDRACYSAPIVIDQAGERVVVCWTGDSVAGLDATSGEVLWKHAFPPKQVIIGIATPVIDDDRLFITSFYDGGLMLKLRDDEPAVEQLWHHVGPSEQQTEALHSIISTPILDGKHIYGVDSYGELRCLDAQTGARLWESLDATPRARWSNIHMVRNADRVWMFNERGELIIARLSPEGFEEISRAKLIEPTTDQLGQRGGVCWAHPAYAYRHVFARNDREIVCASLAAE